MTGDDEATHSAEKREPGEPSTTHHHSFAKGISSKPFDLSQTKNLALVGLAWVAIYALWTIQQDQEQRGPGSLDMKTYTFGHRKAS